MAWTSTFSQRTALIIGQEGEAKLAGSRVAVFGLGGVGAACALDLARCGVGELIVCDFDVVEESNLNRLAFGYHRFLGRSKTELFTELAKDINPEIRVTAGVSFISGAGAETAVPDNCDGYVDCIDSLNAKVNLIAVLVRAKKTFISAMGTAGRLDPSRLRYASIWDSDGCPLARALRQRLRRLGFDKTVEIPCVWSDEPASPPGSYPDSEKATETESLASFIEPKRAPPGRPRRCLGSAPFVPQAAGHLLASWLVRRLLSPQRPIL